MTVLQNLIFVCLGLCGGILVAGGLFAFLAMVGVVTRLAAGTRTAKWVMFYEDMALLGGTIGNVAYIFNKGLPTGTVWFLLYGLCAGIFTGCLAAALAEVVKMLPVLSERVSLKRGMTGIMLLFALGKMAGALLDLLG